MKKVIVFLLAFSALPCLLSAQSKKGKASITISNTSALNRPDAVTAIVWESILSKYPDIDTANFKVLNTAGKEVPFQLEYKGLAKPQNLLVQVSAGPKSTVKLSVVPGKAAVAVAKTFGRYVPERKDDFAWENDKIAFRMYGKALEGTKENAFGIDVWGKRTDRMILNERYKRGEYHIDHGDGMDYYHVGLTLGAGDNAPYTKDTIHYPLNYRTWKILDQGPLRFTFQLTYAEWDVAGKAVKATKTISLDAGSQLNRMEVNYQYQGDAALPVVVGVIRRAEPGSIVLDEQQGIMGYWEPEHGKDGITGVGTILSGTKITMKVNNEQLLAYTDTKSGQPLVYYTGAAWNKANIITNAAAWFQYLNNFKQSLVQPLTVTVQ